MTGARPIALGIAFGVASGIAPGACATAPPPGAPAGVAQRTFDNAPTPSTIVPPDPARAVDGDVTAAWLRGMQIVVKRVPDAEFVAGQLYVLGGVRNWSEGDAGVERLALAVSVTGGTTRLERDAFSRRLAQLGATLNAAATEDYSALAGKSLRENWDATFALLVDAFLRPALPAQEIEIQRQRQLSELRHELEQPDERLQLIAHQAMFKGHPYQHRAIGTLASVRALDRAALVAHLAKLRETGRLLLVVVGDVDASHIIDEAGRALGHLPRGSFRPAPLAVPSPGDPRVIVVEKKMPTNYIESRFFAPSWRDPDFATGLVTMSVLGWRVFEEVRTKRNLSYAPHATLLRRTELPMGELYVTAVDPNATIKVMFDEARKLQVEAVSEAELVSDKSVFLTGFLMASESTDGQATLLGQCQIYGGDWRRARTLPAQIRAVTSDGVQQFARHYFEKLRTIVLGDPTKIDTALFQSL